MKSKFTNKDFLQELLTTMTSANRLELRIGTRDLLVIRKHKEEVDYVVDNDTGEILYGMKVGPEDLYTSEWCDEEYKFKDWL